MFLMCFLVMFCGAVLFVLFCSLALFFFVLFPGVFVCALFVVVAFRCCLFRAVFWCCCWCCLFCDVFGGVFGAVFRCCVSLMCFVDVCLVVFFPRCCFVAAVFR